MVILRVGGRGTDKPTHINGLGLGSGGCLEGRGEGRRKRGEGDGKGGEGRGEGEPTDPRTHRRITIPVKINTVTNIKLIPKQ